ncbi:Cytochrome c oxidase subunit 2 precursor [Planctomycetes bacterium Pan216]|uniref:Cytochrome c oxidase subunit 2 n=1 Tax=Kolteria novifilia TaxID=2527975 RepID=A0A518BAA6_9BACT|nr:Cytochrome c oxidase subunit 2 precursor [Planctomycetes bacterium Pan216]
MTGQRPKGLIPVQAKRHGRGILLLAFGLLFFASSVFAAGETNIVQTVSPPADSIKFLFYLLLAVVGAIFLIVEGALIYCMVRFRKREGDESEPPQIYGSKPVEIAWTVAPALIVFVLFLVVLRSIVQIRKVDVPEDALRVVVTGHQWWWEFHYPELGVTTANELHVPIGDDENERAVFLDLQSVDVIHSFWVPQLSGKMDVVPGRTNLLWFATKQPGLYRGQCAEYCGTQHANMLLRVVAESPEEFERWAAQQAKPAVDDPKVAAGRQLFMSLACMNCHTIKGTPANGTFAPDLTHLMSRQTLASGMVENNPKNLRDWVDNPQSIKPGCLMPSFQLSSKQLDDLVAYLETLH